MKDEGKDLKSDATKMEIHELLAAQLDDRKAVVLAQYGLDGQVQYLLLGLACYLRSTRGAVAAVVTALCPAPGPDIVI